jgi:predicted transposase/invertase (TIGR01784 family)
MITHLEQNFKRYFNEAEKKGEIKGKIEGIREGEKRGVIKEKIETAQAMLRMKLDVNVIAAATRLPLDEIEKLKPDA